MLNSLKLLIIFSFLKGIKNFGNECRQIIQETFFDISLLKSEKDYTYTFENEDENKALTINFNFCKYISHKCHSKAPSYFMVGFNSENCHYFRENSKKHPHYSLLKNKSEIGLKINYLDVQEMGQEINLNLLCNENLKIEEPILFKNSTVVNDTYNLFFESKNICPQVISNIIYDFVESFKYFFFLIGILIGPAELFLGNKIFGITVFIVF